MELQASKMRSGVPKSAASDGSGLTSEKSLMFSVPQPPSEMFSKRSQKVAPTVPPPPPPGSSGATVTVMVAASSSAPSEAV